MDIDVLQQEETAVAHVHLARQFRGVRRSEYCCHLVFTAWPHLGDDDTTPDHDNSLGLRVELEKQNQAIGLRGEVKARGRIDYEARGEVIVGLTAHAATHGADSLVLDMIGSHRRLAKAWSRA
jgi:hypothetical protein